MKKTGKAMDNGELFCDCCGVGCRKTGKTLLIKRAMESVEENRVKKKGILKLKLFSDDGTVTVLVRVRDSRS
jgi:hypothetical protein